LSMVLKFATKRISLLPWKAFVFFIVELRPSSNESDQHWQGASQLFIREALSMQLRRKSSICLSRCSQRFLSVKGRTTHKRNNLALFLKFVIYLKWCHPQENLAKFGYKKYEGKKVWSRKWTDSPRKVTG
jgi:hypothetical protein